MSHEVPSPHSSFSANKIQPIFIYFLLPSAASPLPTYQLFRQGMEVVDQHFSAWTTNIVEEEHVHFQGGDLLLVSLKAPLWE